MPQTAFYPLFHFAGEFHFPVPDAMP
jgi:hypothetical protein